MMNFKLLATTIVCVLIISAGIYALVIFEGESQLYVIDVYDSSKAYNGTTLFADLHDDPVIVEVDMNGKIVWKYELPDNLKEYKNPGFDVELLSDNHILFVAPKKGVFEIDRAGNIVWSHLDSKISHDADRLPNGNTIYVFGGDDEKTDNQVKEVNSNGEVVWYWAAKDYFENSSYSDIERGGWTHTNAVTRLDNGNTLINLRNFALTVEVDSQGSVVRTFDWSNYGSKTDPHDPEVEADGDLLVCLQNDSPYQAVEINIENSSVMWTYYRSGLRTVRDCDRLPNGNTLMVGVLAEESVIFEVGKGPGWFYKAERIG